MKRTFIKLTDKSSQKCRSLTQKFKRDDSGMAAIEMAFIFPVMIIMLVGLVDVTDGLSANRKVTITANTLGDLVSQEPGTTDKSNLNGIFAAAIQTMVPYDGATVGLEIFDYRILPSASKPTLNWEHRSGTNCGAAPAVTDDMAALTSQGNDLIISRTCYNFSYILGSLFSGATSFKMTDEMTLRPRKSLQLECSDC